MAQGGAAEHQDLLSGESDQSRARGARHPARFRARARARAAAARRFDVYDAVAHAAVRSRRRHRLPFRDQVPVGPRRRHRRRARRLGPVRLRHRARARAVSNARRPVRGVSRHGLRGRVVHRVVPVARAARRRPRFRRVHGAHDGLPDPAGHRDAAGADGTPRREHARDRRLPARAAAGGSDRLSGVARASGPRAHAALASARLRIGVQLQPARDARAGPQVHRGAARVLAPRERRRREIARHPPGVDDALPHVGGRPAEGRRHRRHDPAVDRARGSVGPDRGPRRALYAAGKG